MHRPSSGQSVMTRPDTTTAPEHSVKIDAAVDPMPPVSRRSGLSAGCLLLLLLVVAFTSQWNALNLLSPQRETWSDGASLSLQTACSASPSRHAFVFYAKQPSDDVLGFAVELSERTPFGVYVVVDDESFAWPAAQQHPGVQVVIVPKSVNIAANFTHSGSFTFTGKSPDQAVWALDRALLLATSDDFARRYCRVWLVEDDVFIPSVQAAVHVDQLAGDSDYVSTSKIFSWPTYWPHWKQFSESLSRFPIPSEHWRRSMVNAVGMSTRFLSVLGSFPARNGRFLYSEAMLPTFANFFNMTHLPLDLLHLLWRLPDGKSDYTWRHIRSTPNAALTWFHPMKDQALRRRYRQLFSKQ